MNKNIIIVGGDGFCGWPLSLRLSKKGYNIIIIDNFSRRKIDTELHSNSLTKIRSLEFRLKTWHKVSGKRIKFYKLNVVTEIRKLKNIVSKYKPLAIYMFAELKSAPYSMLSLNHSNKNFNNIVANNNLLYIISRYSKHTHFIHVGTMGVYGYDFSEKKLPEGYYKAKLFSSNNTYQFKEILHPSSPGSIYHLTKAQDELLFQYYYKMYKTKITDLHQGIVWGCQTYETEIHKNLVNRFDYDHVYGTFINRVVVQSAIKHPLILHGSGMQLRPIINIKDAINSFELVLKTKKFKKVNIINEFGEIIRLSELANFLSFKYGSKILKINNPRIETEKNLLLADNSYLKSEGLKFTKISIKEIKSLLELAIVNKKRIIRKKIINSINWERKKLI